MWEKFCFPTFSDLMYITFAIIHVICTSMYNAHVHVSLNIYILVCTLYMYCMCIHYAKLQAYMEVWEFSVCTFCACMCQYTCTCSFIPFYKALLNVYVHVHVNIWTGYVWLSNHLLTLTWNHFCSRLRKSVVNYMYMCM